MAMDIFAASVKIGLPHLNITRVHLNRFLEMVHNGLTQRDREWVDPEYNEANAAECSLLRSIFSNQGSGASSFNVGQQDDRGMRRSGRAAGRVLVARSGSAL